MSNKRLSRFGETIIDVTLPETSDGHLVIVLYHGDKRFRIATNDKYEVSEFGRALGEAHGVLSQEQEWHE